MDEWLPLVYYRAIVFNAGTLAMSRENVGFHKWRVLLAAHWYRSRMLLHILKYKGQTKNYLVQNDNVTKAERP